MKAAEIPVGIIRGQLDPQLYSTHLAPLEHKLFLGGSVYRDYDGTGYNETGRELLETEEIFQADEALLVNPPGFTGRETRKHTFIEGYFPIFHSLKMLEKGYKHRVYLPAVRNGRIEPKFRIHLLTAEGELVREQEVIDEVMQNFPQDYRKYFTLSPGRELGELTLVKSVRVASSPVAV